MCLNKVLIINEGYSDNLGDQAINKSLQYLLKRKGFNEIVFQDFTKNLKSPIKIVKEEFDSSNSSVLKNILRLCISEKVRWLLRNSIRIISTARKKFDLVLIGGGQLILSNGTFSIAMFFWVLTLYRFQNKKIILYGVGCGNDFSFINKILYLNALKYVDKVVVRDAQSKLNLKLKFGVSALIIDDIAFLYNLTIRKERDFTDSKNKILLGITSFQVYQIYNRRNCTKQEYFNSWIELLNKKSIKLNQVDLFYTTQKDRFECMEFKAYVKKKFNLVLTICETNNLDLLQYQLSCSKVVISGRMHALILALSSGAQIVAYTISEKLKSFEKMYCDKFDLKCIQNNIFQLTDSILNE